MGQTLSPTVIMVYNKLTFRELISQLYNRVALHPLSVYHIAPYIIYPIFICIRRQLLE
jgi:hypothetical protein